MVFLCALLPISETSWTEQVAQDPSMIAAGFGHGLQVDSQGRTVWSDPSAARAAMYADCTDGDVRFALENLRPQAQAPYQEKCPLASWPEVRAAYVLASDDRVVSADWARAAARARLAVEPREVGGGHSPFLSRPTELADLLEDISIR